MNKELRKYPTREQYAYLNNQITAGYITPTQFGFTGIKSFKWENGSLTAIEGRFLGGGIREVFCYEVRLGKGEGHVFRCKHYGYALKAVYGYVKAHKGE